MATSILAHGAALALAAAIVDPILSDGDGAATIVVSLAERRSLGAVMAPRPASVTPKMSQPDAAPKASDLRNPGSVDPAELPERIPAPETAERRVESPEARSSADAGGADAEATVGASDERLDGVEAAGASPTAPGGSAAYGPSASEGGSPTILSGSGAVDAVGNTADAAGNAAADFKRAFLERLSYPESARRAGASGTVGLLVRIDEYGRVAWARVRSSSGSSSLDRAALAAAKSVAGVSPPGVPLSVTIQAVFAPASP